jgi:chemotaxis protein CheX
MMNEKEVNVFIKGAKNYFKTVSQQEVEIGTPYLVNSRDAAVGDYTGIIGISGERKGCVFVTAPTAMLRHLLISIGEESQDKAIIRDVIGEVANTISGNARSEFGPDFMISVPVVVEGKPQMISVPGDLMAFVIPVQWNNYSLHVVACLE